MNHEMGIPRFVHQTRRDMDPPAAVYDPAWASSWRTQNPGWGYRLWTDDDLVELTKREMPEALHWFRSYPGVVRADFGRYLMLWAEGGFYADLDYECLQSFEEFTSSALFLSYDGDWVNIALMGTPPRNPLFRAAAHECILRFGGEMSPATIHNATGPRMFTELCTRSALGSSQIRPMADFAPLDWRREGAMSSGMSRAAAAEHRQRAIAAGAYSITYWTGLWGFDGRSGHGTFPGELDIGGLKDPK